MIKLKCPVCGRELVLKEKSFVCPNGHLFDVAKSGYVNLLKNNTSHGHGDDKIMLNSRTDFLEKGYYKPLFDKICGICENISGQNKTFLDAGCGEGYYSEGISAYFSQGAFIDVSKPAVEKTAKRLKKNGIFAVASVYDLPFFNDSFDVIFSCFSPLADTEFSRVTKSGGKLIRVIPLENHLYELKCAVYDTPYKNETGEKPISGFKLKNETEIKYKLTLSSNEDIINLFNMTPYRYKTSKKDMEKLEKIEKMSCNAEFGILEYQKE